MFAEIAVALAIGAVLGAFLISRPQPSQVNGKVNGDHAEAPSSQQHIEGPQLLEFIRKRRSVYPKDFSGEPVSREQVEQLLEASNWAPTHGKTEPWRYVVIGQDSLKEMLDLTFRLNEKNMEPGKYPQWAEKFQRKQKEFSKVSYFIMICMKRQAAPPKLQPEWEEVAATSSSVQNIYLMAHALGIGGYWSSWTETARDDPEFKAYLGLEPEDRCLGAFLVGCCNAEKVAGYRASRGPIQDKVRWLA